ncbi:MAG: insulinase family protein [Rickettsiales bacterium]|nr:insulinase family protein [Rickettsiales bacterium]
MTRKYFQLILGMAAMVTVSLGLLRRKNIGVGSSIYGFRLVSREVIYNNGRRDTVSLLEHRKTGGKVLYVQNNDPHRFFGIIFSVPTLDKTGVAHILEHSVLSSSRKYKSNELFFELGKFTPATFLNAFTAEGQVCYLFQTMNNRDYLNLMDVYVNAALQPELSEITFRKEGWRLEADRDGRLSYNGVVFNEMKTAYSRPSEHFYIESFRSLFPGLEFDSGGVPNHIMDLSHENLVKFHRNTHNPSNSLTVMYGQGELGRELSLLNASFREFERKKPLRPKFEDKLVNSPVEKIASYPAGKGEEHSYVVFSYVVGNAGDPVVASQVSSLEFLLAGYEDAPLKKEIVRAGLASDVSSSIDFGKGKLVLFIIFEGVKRKNEAKIEPILRSIFETVASQGFGERAEEAARSIRRYEIGSEARFELSRGEKIFSLNNSYMQGGDPKKHFNRKKIYDEFHRTVSGKDAWKNLTRKMLLDNRRRATIVFRPSEHMLDQQEKEIGAKLDALRKKMSAAELKKLQQETEEFQREMTRRIETDFPRISLEDWKNERLAIRTRAEDLEGVKVLYNDLESNGLAQVSFAFDLGLIPQEMLPAVGVYSLLFDALDSKARSNADLYLEQSRILGRPLARSISVKSSYGGKKALARLIVVLRGFDDNMGKNAFDLLSENLFELAYSTQEDRIRNILERTVQEIEMSIRRNGYYIFSDASARKILASHLAEEKYYLYLKSLVEDWNSGYRRLLSDLDYVRANLLVRNNLVVNVVGRRKVLEETKKYIKTLPLGASKGVARDPDIRKLNQARIVPARNYRNYMRCDSRGRTWEIHFLPEFMAWNYLYPEIRVKNGAYGSKLSMDADQMLFYSYSDPNIVNSFEVFRNAGKFLRNLRMSDRDFEGVKINSLALYTYPRTSFEKGMMVLENYLIGRTDGDIKKEYKTIKNLKQEDLRALADYVEQCLGDSQIATQGPKEGIDENKGLFDEIR